MHFRQHLNLYIGWGQKYEAFQPSFPSRFETEYPFELIEATDPSVELEKRAEERRQEESTLGALTSSDEMENDIDEEEEEEAEELD